MVDESVTVATRGTCTNCGAFVTTAFARVFGDNDDRVAGCPECMSFKRITMGEAAGAGDEHSVDRPR